MRPILLTALFPLLAACGQPASEVEPSNGPVDPSALRLTEIIGIGKVEPEHEIINLSATAGGVITRVFKQDGDSVRKDEILLQLDDDLEQARIRELRSQLTTQRAQISIEESSLRSVELQHIYKQKQLATAKALVQKGAETRQAADDLESEVNTLAADVDKAKASVRYAEGKLEELAQQLHVAETEARKKQLRAPLDGYLLDMQVTPGAAIAQYGTYAEFAPTGRKIIRAEVDELFCQQLRIGQQVKVRYTGTEAIIAHGEVAMLSPYLKKKSLFSEKAGDQEDRRVREIRIALQDDPDLLINAKVECIITL